MLFHDSERGLTKWLWDGQICCRSYGRGATEGEFKPWPTNAVTHANGSGELDTRKCDPAVKGRTIHDYERKTYKSPALILCFAINGDRVETISSIPPLAW